ncbi:MAG: T9SS type A sorting domain-containing protein, partial [Bacteroidales bacterium]|nr:T9SS type A sorting domain-containing protein [Bacteroidales bacterium]
FTLSPNPATGTVTVTVGSLTHSSALAGTSPNLGEEFSLTMTDAAGREVLRKEFSIVNCQFSIPLDLSGLPAGIYYVTLSTPTATGTQRLVVK